MKYDIDKLPKIIAEGKYTAANRSKGDILWVVIHDMEAPEKSTTAENVAKYFRDSNVKASAHLNVDNDSIVRSVEDKNVAWAAPGANRYGLQIELAGYARQTRQEWLDEYSKDVLDGAAQVTAQYCVRYGIPAARLNLDQIKRNEKGIIGHVDATNAFGKSSHTDPGANFPWDHFLGLVLKYIKEINVGARRYKMLVYGKRGTPDFDVACAGVDMANRGVATASLDEAAAAVERGELVVAVGGPAIEVLGFSNTKGAVVTNGNKVAVRGNTGLQTMELLATYLGA